MKGGLIPKRRTEPCGGPVPGAGIVLILLSGVVVVLLILAMTLLQMTRAWARGAEARTAAAQARLAAAAGMEYAAARLARERTYPRFSTTPLDRGDDWTERQGTGVGGQGSENPSYAHGEAWVEGGVPDGLYAPADARGPDLDGDGRFSAWSGRVRGGAGGLGIRFSLRIESVGGKVPVNAGGAPTTSYAKGLAHLLNNLGAILFPDDGTRAWRKDAASGVPLGVGEPILCSRLGDHLFAARPSKGYASLEEIDETLKRMGYAEKDRRDILPFLDVGPYASKPDGGRPTYPYVPIEMATASREILQAAWMYLGHGLRFCPGDAILFSNMYRRSGPANLRFIDTGADPAIGMLAMIFPEEAGALAAEADDLRRSGLYSWIALRERFLQKAPAIFWKDLDDLDESFAGPTTPMAQAGWARGKADIAYFAAALSPPPYPPTPQAMNFLPVPSAPQPLVLIDPVVPFCRVHYPDLSTGSWAPWSGNAPFQLTSGWIETEGLTMAPPGLFRVASAGGAAGRASAGQSAVLRAADRLDLSSQEDFENLSGGALLESAWGLQVLDPLPAAKRAALLDPDSGRTYPQVASVPVLNASRSPLPAYPRYTGALVLAGRECGSLGAGQYWPFSEDLDGNPSNDFYSVPSLLPPRAPIRIQVGGVPHAPTQEIWSFFEAPGLDGPPGTYVEQLSMEAWRMPGLMPTAGPGEGLWLSNLMSPATAFLFRSWRDVQGGRPGHLLRFTVGTSVGAVAPPAIFVPDDDGAGNVSSGLHHFVLTLRRYQAIAPDKYRTKVHLYLNGTELVSGGSDLPDSTYMSINMLWFLEYFQWFRFSDEIRLYDRELSSAEVGDHYEMGRFVPPWQGPAADPLATPLNPTYRSPRYVLSGGTVRWASWTGWSTPALLDKVRMRVRLYGFDAAGAKIWEEELPGEGLWSPLQVPPAHSFQYVVELYSPTGAPTAPLYDTPSFGPISFMIQRPGAAPAWSAWSEK